MKRRFIWGVQGILCRWGNLREKITRYVLEKTVRMYIFRWKIPKKYFALMK